MTALDTPLADTRSSMKLDGNVDAILTIDLLVCTRNFSINSVYLLLRYLMLSDDLLDMLVFLHIRP